MFDTVLVANRGEIAVRVMTTLRRMGIRSVAVYSDAERRARHVLEADHAVRIGPAEPTRSYLAIPEIIRAALDSGAQAVHPGYGFLSENADFAQACGAAGLVFLGPPPSAITAMSDKIEAKSTVSAAGVPVLTGHAVPENAATVAEDIGYPLLLKPSAGGGGKGMQRVDGPDELPFAIASARRAAEAAFGDGQLLMEHLITAPRHIEVQILADEHGRVLHLGERECSLQRRHQKILEEAPSVVLDDDIREAMGESALAVARAVGYVGAGTVEFLVSAAAPRDFFFLEMNTRLQVEHPVTELVTGVDLVEWQLRIAAGERLPFRQQDIVSTGHAVEARVYAEDPARDFLPTGGTVLEDVLPTEPNIRVDSGILAGMTIGSDYDPLLAKIIAWGDDRQTALRTLERSLGKTAVLGVPTNVGFLRALLRDPEVRAGTIDTELVERRRDAFVADDVPAEFLIAGALDRFLALQPVGAVVDPWDLPGGWRMGTEAGLTLRLLIEDQEVPVQLWGRPDRASVRVADGPVVEACAEWDGSWLIVDRPGEQRSYRRAQAGDGTVWLAREGRAVTVAKRSDLLSDQEKSDRSGPVTSPMPGTVLSIEVRPGEAVRAGARLVVVEAMKMEYTMTAPVPGVVDELPVQVGEQVGLDQLLVRVVPEENAT